MKQQILALIDRKIEEWTLQGNVSFSSLIELRSEIEKMNEWIPVTERLPEEMVRVLVYTVDGVIGVMRLTKFKEWSKPGVGYSFEHVTHWQPLPLPPNQ